MVRSFMCAAGLARPVSRTACVLGALLAFHPPLPAAQAESDDSAAVVTEPSTEISSFRGIEWGTTEAELVEAFGQPVEQRQLETGLELMAYRSELVGQPSLILFGLLDEEGLVKAQEVIDVPGGDACIDMIRSIHHQIDLQYPLIRPSEQAKNNTPDAICDAAPAGSAYWHRQWRDEETGSVITVSLASGSQQLDVTYESRQFRDWAEPDQAESAEPLEDEGAPTEILEAAP